MWIVSTVTQVEGVQTRCEVGADLNDKHSLMDDVLLNDDDIHGRKLIYFSVHL